MTYSPDNNRQYDQIPIPPGLESSNAIQFMQDRYGLYNKGTNFYIEDDHTLLIYPKYEVAPPAPLKPGYLNLYKLPNKSYQGIEAYVAQVGEDLHGLVNDDIDMQDLSEKGVENGGNAAMLTRADSGVDIYKQETEDASKLQDMKTVTIMADGKNTAVANAQYTKYTKPQDNAYKQMEQMSATDCIMATIPIKHLDPWAVFPGMPVIYHYEEKETYKTVRGIVVGIASDLNYENRPAEFIYSWSSKVVVRLVPDKKEPDPSAGQPVDQTQV